VRICHPRCNSSCTYLIIPCFYNGFINLLILPITLRHLLLGSFIKLVSTVTNSEYITSIFNAYSHLQDSISLAPYLTRSAEHAAEQPKDPDVSFSSLFQLLRTSLSAVHSPIPKQDYAPPHFNFFFRCASLHIFRAPVARKTTVSTYYLRHNLLNLKHYNLVPEPTDILGALERDVLKPYENTLDDKPELSRLYGPSLQPANLTSVFFWFWHRGRLWLSEVRIDDAVNYIPVGY